MNNKPSLKATTTKSNDFFQSTTNGLYIEYTIYAEWQQTGKSPATLL